MHSRKHRAIVVLDQERLVAGYYIVEDGELGEGSGTEEGRLLVFPYHLGQMIEAFGRACNVSRTKDKW